MNGNHLLVIVYGVCAILFGAVLVAVDVADAPYAWPLIAVIMLLVLALPYAWERYARWSGRQKAKKIWR